MTPLSSSWTDSIWWPVISHRACKSRRPLTSSARNSTRVPLGSPWVRFLKRRTGSGHTRPTASIRYTSVWSVKAHTRGAAALFCGGPAKLVQYHGRANGNDQSHDKRGYHNFHEEPPLPCFASTSSTHRSCCWRAHSRST